MEQDFLPRMTLIAETGGVDRRTLDRLHRRLALIPGGREDRIIVRTLDDHLSRTAFAPERIATVLVGASATIALALGMLGLYGIMSDACAPPAARVRAAHRPRRAAADTCSAR